MGISLRRQSKHATSRAICPAAQKKIYDLEQAPKIRVATFNIAAGRVSDINTIAMAIKVINPDVMALQEVDRLTARSGRLDQAAELAILTGMHADFGRAINYDGGEYGLAFLSKYPLQGNRVSPLSSGRREQRIVFSAQTEMPGFPTPITLINTHLDASRGPSMRLKQVRELNELSAEMRGVKLLFGDMNDVPGGATWRQLRRAWGDVTPETQDCRSWPALKPEMQLDYIFGDCAQRWHVDSLTVPSADCEWSGVNWSTISDHLPIVAELRLIEYLLRMNEQTFAFGF